MAEVKKFSSRPENFIKALSDHIYNDSHVPAEFSSEKLLYFFKHRILRSEDLESSAHERLFDDDKLRAYMEKILDGQNPFPKLIEKSPKKIFCIRFSEYLQESGIWPDAPLNVFSKQEGAPTKIVADSPSLFTQNFNVNLSMENRLRYLVSNLYDLTIRDPRGDEVLTGGHGIIFMAALATVNARPGSAFECYFSDLISSDFDAPTGFVRHQPENAPLVTDEAFQDVTAKYYHMPESLDKAKKEMLKTYCDIVKVLATDIMWKLIKEFEPLNSGNLPRTVFDVEQGAVFVHEAERHRIWIVSFAPDQFRVPAADREIQRIVSEYNRLREKI